SSRSLPSGAMEPSRPAAPGFARPSAISAPPSLSTWAWMRRPQRPCGNEARNQALLVLGFAVCVRVAAVHKLVKPASFSRGRLLLEQEREIGIVEFLEEFIPGDFFQTFVRRSEIQAKDPRLVILFGISHRGGVAASCFGPFADLVVVGGDICPCYLSLLAHARAARATSMET